MFFSFKKGTSYSALPGSESPREKDAPPRKQRFAIIAASAVACVSVVAFIVIFFFFSASNPQKACTHPRIRPEWRTLSRVEKTSYLAAAHCLTTTPSSRDSKVTVHDEFSYLHSRIGNYSHNAGPFLPWHRYFLVAYENALNHHCQYNGPLPYWDWSLDYHNLIASPVWNIDDGFGPSSNSSPAGVNKGHCVDQGPFVNWTPAYYDGNYSPHCLSRGFLDEETVIRVGNLTVRPDVLQRVIRNERDYFEFVLAVETMSHLTIPYIVQGDFVKVTAPNDPVFFLHHGQVDRAWWSWQGVEEERRWRYGGVTRNDSTEEASVRDVLDFGDWLKHGDFVTVEDVMDTEGDLLCYRYDRSVIPS